MCCPAQLYMGSGDLDLKPHILPSTSSLPCPTHSHPFFLRQNLLLYWELTGVSRLNGQPAPVMTDCASPGILGAHCYAQHCAGPRVCATSTFLTEPSPCPKLGPFSKENRSNSEMAAVIAATKLAAKDKIE